MSADTLSFFGLPSFGLPVLFIGLIVFAVSFIATNWFARHLLVADVPNGRSSHTQTASRAGGLSIMLGWMAGLMLAVIVIGTPFTGPVFWLIPFTMLAAGLGCIDDVMPLKPSVKLIGQFILAAAFVSLAGTLTQAPLPFIGQTPLGPLAYPIAIFWIVGLMNAFNFMDGANGLAASNAAIIFVVFAVITAAYIGGAGAGAGLLVISFLMAVAISGFVPYNLTQGSIFMGDAGSQALGFLMAALPLVLTPLTENALSPLLVPVMLLPFIGDVTFTLIHRFARGKNVLQAHREHLYQLLLRMEISHAKVTAIYLSATMITSAFAVMMLGMPARWQWVVPVALLVATLFPALSLFKKAKAAGLLDNAIKADPAELELGPASQRQAAE